MKLLVLNSNNYVAGSNNKFAYNFPNFAQFKQGDKLAVLHWSMYNSIFNVTSANNNNVFQVKLNFATPVTLTITLPDGFYSVDDINSYVEQQMLLGKYYVINSSCENVYFFSMATNSVYYTVNVVTDVIPTSAQATTLGYTQPSGATWSYPTTASTTQIILSANAFGALIGYNVSQTLPATPQTTAQIYNSDVTPNIQPVNSLILRCNLVSSSYSIPVDILHSKTIDVGIGELMTSEPAFPIFLDISPQSFNQLLITVVDQSFNNVNIVDTVGFLLTLAIQTN